MKPHGKTRCRRWGLIGLAAAFLFATVPIVIEAAASGGDDQNLAAPPDHHRHLNMTVGGPLQKNGRFSKETSGDSFAVRVSEIRKMLGTDSL